MGEINSVTVDVTTPTIKKSEAIADKEVASISVDGGEKPYTYVLTGTDADKFKEEGAKIKLAEALTEERAYTAKVKATDKNSKEKESAEFTVTVEADSETVRAVSGVKVKSIK